MLGAGELQSLLDLTGRFSTFDLSVDSAAGRCVAVFPINAYALSSGLVDIKADSLEVLGQVAQWA